MLELKRAVFAKFFQYLSSALKYFTTRLKMPNDNFRNYRFEVMYGPNPQADVVAWGAESFPPLLPRGEPPSPPGPAAAPPRRRTLPRHEAGGPAGGQRRQFFRSGPRGDGSDESLSDSSESRLSHVRDSDGHDSD